MLRTSTLALLLALPLAAQAQTEAEEPAAEAGTSAIGPSVFLAVEGEKAYRVGDWLGAPVRLAGSGDEIGEVENLLVSSQGSTVAAIIGVGGFLGIGEKDIAVDIKSLKASRIDGELTLDLQATREEIDNAPPVAPLLEN